MKCLMGISSSCTAQMYAGQNEYCKWKLYGFINQNTMQKFEYVRFTIQVTRVALPQYFVKQEIRKG